MCLVVVAVAMTISILAIVATVKKKSYIQLNQNYLNIFLKLLFDNRKYFIGKNFKVQLLLI